jgi:hypothetical protein
MSDARQNSGAHAMERQSTNNGQAPNMQMMRGEHSQPSYNSQPKDQLQRSSNQFSTAPIQDREQGQGSKANQIRQGSNINNSSRTTKAQNDRQQSTFNEREGSGKGSMQQKQQIQRQGQLTKQQGNSTTKEAKQVSSDSSGSQQSNKKGSETTKGSEKPAQANGSKGSKDSKNRVTSPRGGPIPI